MQSSESPGPTDDAQLQQLVNSKPRVPFAYYELADGGKRVGIIHVEYSILRPHVITVDFGRLRDDQIPIRRGSFTGGIRQADLVKWFYSLSNPRFRSVVDQLGLGVRHMEVALELDRRLADMQQQTEQDMRRVLGLE